MAAGGGTGAGLGEGVETNELNHEQDFVALFGLERQMQPEWRIFSNAEMQGRRDRIGGPRKDCQFLMVRDSAGDCDTDSEPGTASLPSVDHLQPVLPVRTLNRILREG